jgi:hypothetical protein
VTINGRSAERWDDKELRPSLAALLGTIHRSALGPRYATQRDWGRETKTRALADAPGAMTFPSERSRTA